MEDALKHRILKWLGRPEKPHTSTEIGEISAAIATTIGDVRTENQDRAVIARFLPGRQENEPFVLAAVCDGMGGMADGARCAELALGTLLCDLVRPGAGNLCERLRNAIHLANHEVHRKFRGRGGTTIAAVVFSPTATTGASVGDSRLYVYSNKERLRQISVDDTIAGELSRLKGDSASQLDLESFAQHLAQFVGIGENLEPRLYRLTDYNAGAQYYLTSDGAHGFPTNLLESILTNTPSLLLGIGRIINLSRWCGGKDNATIVSIPADRKRLFGHRNDEGWLLEIWDPYSKIEFAPPDPHQAVGTRVVEKMPAQPAMAPRAAKPRAPKSKKRQARSQQRDKEPRQPRRNSQPKLEIEIGNDEADLDATTDVVPPQAELHGDDAQTTNPLTATKDQK